MLHCDVICLEMENAKVLMEGAGCMLTTDPTCASFAVARACFDRATVDDSRRTAHVVNQDCSHALKLTVHTSTSQCAEAASFGMQLASVQVYPRLKVNEILNSGVILIMAEIRARYR